MDELSRRQAELHKFMLKHHHNHDMWPSLRESADALGVASLNSITLLMKQLLRKGFARRGAGTARGWIAVIK